MIHYKGLCIYSKAGIGVGVGCSEQESERLFLETASAKSLCLLTMVNWNEHSVSARHRMSSNDVNYCHVVIEGSWA